MTRWRRSPLYNLSLWNVCGLPIVKSSWTHNTATIAALSENPSTGLVGFLICEEGRLYSVAASDDLLYTRSGSKNIRVWKNRTEFSEFKSDSGLMKALVISVERIFTGEQDDKILIWKVLPKDPKIYKGVGILLRLKDFLKSFINPLNHVKVHMHRNTIWLRHFDVVSCLSLDEEAGLLCSGL